MSSADPVRQAFWLAALDRVPIEERVEWVETMVARFAEAFPETTKVRPAAWSSDDDCAGETGLDAASYLGLRLGLQ